MRNREIAAHGGCNLFLRPKSKERATNTAFRWGYGVDSKHRECSHTPEKAPVCALLVGIGPFDTEEELFNALKEYTDTEVEAGTMSQAEATALLEKYQ